VTTKPVLALMWTVLLAVTSLGAFGGTAPAAASAAAPGAEPGTVEAVHWGPCDAETMKVVPLAQAKSISCATYRVPIDHDNAALGTIDIALMRRAADKPAARIGSLFLNPGGPGGAGRMLAVAGEEVFDQQVLDRFDLIGFDPRGVGRSNPLRCFTTEEDAREVRDGALNVPLTREGISDSLNSYREYGQFCERNAGVLLHHMSTKNVVRDLDLLRAAVGDEKLNYVGFSYGTLIGATYANMFPERVRALVLDGNVDPALRTSDGLKYDRARADGFEIALAAFLDRCDHVGQKCAFSPGDPRKKFDELRSKLRAGPLELSDGAIVDISSFTNGVAGSLYSPAAFRGLAADLQRIYEVLHPPATPQPQATTGADFRTLLSPPQNARFDVLPDSTYTSNDSYLAVNCSDKVFSYPQERLPEFAANWEDESPTFGRTHAFADPAGCPAWPVQDPDAYRGPWNRATENPVLVIGNYYDPATQYSFSQRMADQLGYARLVSVDAFGHCILGSSSGVDAATADYLTDLTVPPPGQVYQPDVAPFDHPAAT
jgi:pimeloyl-ACP methyl ester carboxylesterase